MAREISDERKAAYYIGNGLKILGFVLFLSTFVSGIAHFGDFTDFVPRGQNMAGRAFGGIVLIILGGVVSRIGARGLAGSGTILDPEQAREDVEPYARMAGGIVKDAMHEAGIAIGQSGAEHEKTVVKIKCRACGQLNEEDAKFCKECGKPV